MPTDILLIQDRSGSMDDDATATSCLGGCGANSKWAQVFAAVQQVVTTTDTTVNWGLKFFADTDGLCGVGNGVAVTVGPHNGSAMVAQFQASTKANGGLDGGSRTPTRLAVQAGAAYLATLTDANPRYILLATDGLPNCSPDNPTNQTADDSAGATAAIAAAATMGFKTFVVGIGNTMGDATLNMFADAGGEAQTGAATHFYQINDTASLVSALGAILGHAVSCRFDIGAAPNSMTSDDFIDVFGDGTAIPKDSTMTNGWYYTNTAHTSIEIYGPTCDKITGGAIRNVTVTFRCIIN
jgi:hypothetical protein